MVFVIGLAAALSLGLGFVLQQRAAARAPMEEMLSPRLLLDLAHRPLWLCGIAAMVAGQVLGGLALRMAPVALVEPLLATNLLFALAIAGVLSGQRLRRREFGGGVLLVLGLGAFILVGHPKGPSSGSQAPGLLPLALTLGLVALLVVTLVVVGKQRKLTDEAVLLATAAGLLYGVQDAFTRQALLSLDQGVGHMLLTVWPYVVVATAVLGLLLAQSAFEAAPLDYSLPSITAAEPLTGIAVGVGLLGDRVGVSISDLAVEATSVVAVLAGVYLVTRCQHLVGSGRTGGRHPRGAL